mmetsp:Transcript_30158/g.55391  ORF Transcript_30158/g.55391 Transcript_30158/m.55391 type:complete len:1041 (+) Transcript_30158:135-3257(+)
MIQTSIDAIIKAGSRSQLVAGAFEAVGGLQMEILLFMVAYWVYAVLFGNYRIWKKKAGLKPSRIPSGKLAESDSSPRDSSPTQFRPPPGLAPPSAHRRPSPGRMSPLAKAIEGLLRKGSDVATIAQELDSNLGICTPEAALEALADLLDSFGRTQGVELVSAVQRVLSQRELKFDARLAELLLRSYFGLRLNSEFHATFAEAAAAGYGDSPGIGILGLKAALRAGDLKLCRERFSNLRYLWKEETPSAAPQVLLQQLTRLAAQAGELPAFLAELGDVTITADSLNAILTECLSSKDSSLLAKVVKFGQAKKVPFSAGIYCTLLKGTTATEEALRLLKEATKLGVATKDVLVSAVTFAIAQKSSIVVEAVLRQLPSNPPPAVAAALINFYVKSTSNVQAKDAALLNLFDKHLSGVDLSADAEAERAVAAAALRQQRRDVVKGLVAAVSDSSRQVALMKSFTPRLADARSIFDACQEKGACHYNALLDVCIDCREMEAAERVMAEATECGVADVVTFNTLVKAHLQSGSVRGARRAMEKMRALGLQPNCVTFNELLDSTIKNSVEDARALIDEMKACGVMPNHITCSILLKSIQTGSKAIDVERIMAVINDMDDEMDEVLLSSVVEACIRVGRGDLLMPQLQRQRTTKRIQVRGAHTYGSIIRAYGYVQDIEGVWDTWRDMRTRQILPTSITLGCMVEALVTNRDVDGGYELIRDVQQDGQCKHLVNAVIFCSVLKGYSHQKRFDRVWEVYQEMLSLRLEFSIVTYNTLVDACARSGEMLKIPKLLEDMVKQGIEPNLITYSAILKGYCQDNQIEKAFDVLDMMRQTTKYRPDEIMFNSLLDGCARVGLYDRGMALLEEMQEVGVKPSNFTLSVLVKLASRGRQLERAFELCEELSKRYRFRLNVHVYSNLVHACIANKDVPRALSVLERMARERVRPDQRTYALLIRAYATAGKAADVTGLLRAAVGLEDVHPQLAGLDAKVLQPQGRLPDDLVAEAVEAVAACDEGMAVELVRGVKRKMPGVKIDTRLKLKMTTRACGAA